MKTLNILLSILLILLAPGCSIAASSSTNSPSPSVLLQTETLTIRPSIEPAIAFTPTHNDTPARRIEPTIDLTYAYEAYHRIPVEQIPYSLDCQQVNGQNKCHDTLLGMSFGYPQDLWKDIQSNLEWGGNNGFEYKYFIDSSPDWPLAGGVSRIYAEGREGIIFDFGIGESADSKKSICGWFYSSACIEVKPNVYLAIMSSDATQCESIPGAMAWGYWYPAAVIAIKLPEQSIINGFTFITSFLSTKDLAKPYSFLNISDTFAPLNCDKTNIEKYNQFFLYLIDGHWQDVSSDARIKFEKIVHLAESIEFDK